jgi:hypothetical protein
VDGDYFLDGGFVGVATTSTTASSSASIRSRLFGQSIVVWNFLCCIIGMIVFFFGSSSSSSRVSWLFGDSLASTHVPKGKGILQQVRIVVGIGMIRGSTSRGVRSSSDHCVTCSFL